jgi:hypothetical protein
MSLAHLQMQSSEDEQGDSASGVNRPDVNIEHDPDGLVD